MSAEPTEVVQLESGTLHVAVEKLRANELVRAGDGEVEVRGSEFDVTVLEGHMSLVHVDHGRVEVRGRRGLPRVLEAGDVWQRPRSSEGDVPVPEVPEARVAASSAGPLPYAGEPGPGAFLSSPRSPALPLVPLSSPTPQVEAPSVALAGDAALLLVAPVASRSAAAPVPAESAAARPTSDALDYAREQERRDRREERRDRRDQRRLR